MDNLANIYLFALVFGGGFFIVSFLVGSYDQGAGDTGGLGHDLELFFEHLGIHVSHGDSESDESTSLLSLRNILAFVAAFGLVGTISTYMQTSPVLTLLLSVPSGIVAAVLSWLMLVLMVSQQSTSQAKGGDFVGKEAVVSVGIPGNNGIGEVSTTIRGQHLSVPARSAFGEPFKKGTSVVIIEYVDGGSVIVAGLD